MNRPQVLLINPAIHSRSQNPKINAIVNRTFPTSLGFLAGYLLARGFDRFELVDEQLTPLSDGDLQALLRSMSKPGIVGITSLTLNVARAYELCRKIKQLNATIKTVLGGIHPTVLPEEALGTGCVDFVARGEAEVLFFDLVNKVLAGAEDYDTLDGISFVQDGRTIHNPDRALLRELDQLPPFPFHLFARDMAHYPGFSGVLGSRGCPHRCSFCSSRSMSGTRYRHHSVSRLIGEFKLLVRKYKQPSVFLLDDDIATNKKHFMALCQAIVREDLHREAYFHGSMRGDNATDDVLDAARAANFQMIYFGLETASERLMAAIDKGETVQQVTDAIRRAAARGIGVGATVIFGLPGETAGDRRHALRFVKGLPLASCRFNTLTPYPGTPAFERARAEGRLLVKGIWENFGVQYLWESSDIPYVPPESGRTELIFDTMYANLAYYLGWGGLRRILTAKYAGGNVVKLQRGWYLRSEEISRIGAAAALLVSRFLKVASALIREKLASAMGKHA